MVDIWEARGRLGSKLASSLDAEGHQIKFDIREDEAQSEKLEQTIELLVAAGYFRARIRGLTAFDKIVGGMTWCISVCSVNIDVDLLYQENSTIGQKIALTEKIVRMLPRLKCPHSIEPHQIQGLDMIHIFPLVQWLVKKAIETRDELGESFRSFAQWKFDSHHTLPPEQSNQEAAGKMMQQIDAVKQCMTPKRRYRCINPEAMVEESERVRSTLLEYGSQSTKESGFSGDNKTEDGRPLSHDEEEDLSRMQQIGPQDKVSARAVASLMNTGEIEQMASQFERHVVERVRTETVGSGDGEIMGDHLDSLQDTVQHLRIELQRLRQEEAEAKQILSSKMSECSQLKADYSAVLAEQKRIEDLESSVDAGTLEALQELTIQHEEIKTQEQEFKQKCKEELAKLEQEIEILRCSSNADKLGSPEALSEAQANFERVQNQLHERRLAMAELNREIALLQRKLDDVPSQAELNQYQRRFLELYNQIAWKHKETKQFYTLFNTLQDVNGHMQKEVDLLNSIYDNYQASGDNTALKSQLLVQLEQIVEGMRQTYQRTDRREREEKLRKEMMQQQLSDLVEKQRLYYKTVRDFQEECRKNDAVVAKIREMGLSPD